MCVCEAILYCVRVRLLYTVCVRLLLYTVCVRGYYSILCVCEATTLYCVCVRLLLYTVCECGYSGLSQVENCNDEAELQRLSDDYISTDTIDISREAMGEVFDDKVG